MFVREKVQVFVLRQLWDFEIDAETADHEKKKKQTLILQNHEVMGYEMRHSRWERTAPWI